jgi:hypothetical protein
MWETSYQARLADWCQLRAQAATAEPVQALLAINNWWAQAPMVNRTITWDNTQVWPDPWNLLVNDGYCDLAKALGIVYTIMLLDIIVYTDLAIICVGQDNLVQVDSGKYILNWAPAELLNIQSVTGTVTRSISSTELQRFLT